MIKDILNTPYKIEIDGESYTLDFDNKAYATLEQVLGKGLFRIYDEFILHKNLKYEECIEVVCCGLSKNYTEKEINTVRLALKEKMFLFMQNIAVISVAFVEPLFPSEFVQQKMNNESKVVKKKEQVDDNETDSFDWVGLYTMATCFLGWSDGDFWAATPRKYFTVLYKYGEIKTGLNNQNREVLVGKKALSALSEIAMGIR